jgi:hypothetical protein
MTSPIKALALLFWAVLLSACTIQLVPSYDQALVEGLDKTNQEALTLFAAVEGGSPKEKFGEYEENYAAVIGGFDALRQRAVSRQIPPLAARISKLSIVRQVCDSKNDPAGCLNVSPASLDRVLQVLRQMRDLHRSSGLNDDLIRPFRRDYQTAMGQVLTIENALKR